MKSNPLVTINIVVLNGEKYIRECLNCVRNQTYKNIEVQIFDNGSTDRTKEIAREFPEFKLIESRSNLGMWPGQEKALETSNGDYIVALSVDVMLHTQFIEKGLTAFESNPRIGALQAKIYSYRHEQLTDGSYQASRAIDTCGFRIERSRRVTNIGHGQHDSEQFVHPREIFAVEGAVPFFRREALDAVQIGDHIIDHDYFWYGDDLDLTWRMRLFGWIQWFDPSVIAYHDRSTTKGHSEGVSDTIKRAPVRQQIPIKKRILDWSNVIFTIVKNEYIINILKDLPFIVIWEVKTLGYWLLFEPRMFAAIPRVLRLLPRMLRKRKLVMKKAIVSPKEMHRWIQ